jgi:hypothetical protein
MMFFICPLIHSLSLYGRKNMTIRDDPHIRNIQQHPPTGIQ